MNKGVKKKENLSIMNKKVGAPKGGRVHWFLWGLDVTNIRQKYTITYLYENKNYMLKSLYYGSKRYDEFIIIRSSNKCYRVTYYDNATTSFDFKNCRTVKDVINYITKKANEKEEQEKKYQERLAGYNSK